MYSLWEQIKNFLQPNDKLYILGDCADRRPHGWTIIKEALAEPRVTYIRGNHDQFLLDAWKSEWRDTYLWFCNGGFDTYNSIIQEDFDKITSYMAQLNKTPYYICYDNKSGQHIHLSHAGFTLLANDEIPNNEDLLWDRDHIIDYCDWWPEENPNDYVVHGHTYCASHSTFCNVKTKLNDTKTIGRYCYGHKVCIDGRSFLTKQIALLDLDTFEEVIFKTSE
jgi:calcineurin-like phosphoesterase family protein